MADFGYDISDYMAIDPIFGTMDDFISLVASAHSKGSVFPIMNIYIHLIQNTECII